MSRKRPIEIDRKTKYELTLMLEKLGSLIDENNAQFNQELDRLKQEHGVRKRAMKAEIGELKTFIRRLRYPQPWWYPLARNAERLARHLQPEQEES